MARLARVRFFPYIAVSAGLHGIALTVLGAVSWGALGSASELREETAIVTLTVSDSPPVLESLETSTIQEIAAWDGEPFEPEPEAPALDVTERLVDEPPPVRSPDAWPDGAPAAVDSRAAAGSETRPAFTATGKTSVIGVGRRGFNADSVAVAAAAPTKETPASNGRSPNERARRGGREPSPVIHREEPSYPVPAIRAGLEGSVLLVATVAADGSVVSVEVARSSGVTLLDQAALEAVRTRWVFSRLPTDSPIHLRRIEIPFRFRLREPGRS